MGGKSIVTYQTVDRSWLWYHPTWCQRGVLDRPGGGLQWAADWCHLAVVQTTTAMCLCTVDEGIAHLMMTSSNGNIFPVTGYLRGPLKKASDAELWCFLWSAPEQTVEQTIETPVFWNAIGLIMTSLWCILLYIWFPHYDEHYHILTTEESPWRQQCV